MSSVQHPSGQDRTFRIRDVAAYLGVTHQRVSMMYAEDKLPEPERVDGIGPLWKPAMIERWAKREWWGTRVEAAAWLATPCERLRPAEQPLDPIVRLPVRPGLSSSSRRYAARVIPRRHATWAIRSPARSRSRRIMSPNIATVGG
jgi:hypothetical protein